MLERIAPSKLGLSDSRLDRVGEWLEKQISSQRLAGASVMIGRRGAIGYARAAGLADVERATPFTEDTIVRIFSMTKPITSVAAMMLYEQGCFQLDDPVAKYLPEFAATQVWKGPGHGLEDVEPQHSPMLIKHLLTHTSGLTYGFMNTNVVDAAYRAQQLEFPGKAATLAEWVEGLASVPLLCQPGSQWNYSVATDVLGRLVEVWSQQELASFFNEHIFVPLAMGDTAFSVAPQNQSRFAALYAPLSGGDMSSVGRKSSAPSEQPRGGLKQMESSLFSVNAVTEEYIEGL
ncbi:MAG TPA: serine hydrolase, partial [Gammaproteobacteria bacterium]|nr:serine hydrolase [Gammaproteobacteria bacterium]